MKMRRKPRAERATGAKGKHRLKRGLLIALAIFVFLCVVGAIAGGGTSRDTSPTAQPTQASQEAPSTHLTLREPRLGPP